MYKWNPVITGTDRQKNLAALPRVFFTRKRMAVLPGGEKKVALITR